MPLQLRSLIRPDGQLELSLVEMPQPEPATPDEVVLRVEAAPINPSDLGNLLAGAKLQEARLSGSAERPVLTAPLPPAALAAAQRMARRMLVADSCGIMRAHSAALRLVPWARMPA